MLFSRPLVYTSQKGLGLGLEIKVLVLVLKKVLIRSLVKIYPQRENEIGLHKMTLIIIINNEKLVVLNRV